MIADAVVSKPPWRCAPMIGVWLNFLQCARVMQGTAGLGNSPVIITT
jgi:hypothetical protein